MGDLAGILFSSDKRKRLLLLLKSGARTWEEIKTNLEVTASGMLPQIHILEKEGLIIRAGKNYQLSDLGCSLFTIWNPLVSTVESFESNKKFWKEHNIGAIPFEMLKRFRN